jgi:phage/conjugal plasmid C-4 type zinc finger TraR family protein
MSDEIDRANDLAEFTTSNAVQQYLRQMNESLQPQRVIDATVFCLDCENDIPLQRLAALPNCVRCIGCQQAEEHNYKVG